MLVVLNGEDREIRSVNLSDLLGELNISGKKVAIELNKVIVPRDTYADANLNEGDQIEIVHFIGGG